MKEVKGNINIWEYPADVVCLPTNGERDAYGYGVVGRNMTYDLAVVAERQFPGISERLSKSMWEVGFRFALIHGSVDELRVLSFPMKQSFRAYADFDLIHESAMYLAKTANHHPGLTFLLISPNHGGGECTWDDVKTLIAPILPDNVHVVDFEDLIL